MKINDYKKIEIMIIEYYLNLKMISAKTERVQKLKEILKNIDNWHLDTDIQAVNNDKICVSGGALPYSSMDKQIDNIFTNIEIIEKEKEHIYTEIIKNEHLIRELEKKNIKTNELLSMLDKESQELLYLKYGEEYSYDEIAEKILTCKSNVHIKIKNIMRDLHKLIVYMNSIKNS